MGVFSLTGWSRLFQTGFLVSRPTQDTAIVQLTCLYGPFTLFGRTFQIVPVHSRLIVAVLLPRRCRNNVGLGSFPFARRYLGNRCFFLFLLLLRCFSSEGWPPSPDMSGLLPDRLSHSEISGSSLVCKSPELIAAYHVFHRLQEPRHSPCALFYFLLRTCRLLTSMHCISSP